MNLKGNSLEESLMAYCPNCGAYVPDGQGICLACKYDLEAAEKKKAEEASASASAQQSAPDSNEEMRRKLEEQRRRAREQNLKWAEEQRKRREEEAQREAARKAQQEKDREWARKEYERRKAQQAAQQASAAAGAHYYGSTESGNAGTTGEGNRALAALSYLSFLFILPGILTPQDEFARYHAKQGLKLFIFGIIADLLISAFGLGFLVWIARIYLAVRGISNAINGRKEPLPSIGTIGDK
jgi:uncharacterized membrane protein